MEITLFSVLLRAGLCRACCSGLGPVGFWMFFVNNFAYSNLFMALSSQFICVCVCCFEEEIRKNAGSLGE